MSTKLKLIVVLAGLLGSALPAHADGMAKKKPSMKDTPVAAASSHCGSGPFAGAYIGASAGYGWTHSNSETYYGESYAEDHHDSFVGGIHGGYNWQCDRFVVGFESDFNFGDLESKSTYFDDSLTSHMDHFGTIRGRFGIAHDHTLFYVTGGLAYANLDHGFNSPFYGHYANHTETKWGYVVGGGVELSRGHWTIRAEGLYLDFKDTDRSYAVGGCFVCGSTNYDTKWEDSFFVARVGLSFKFGGHEPSYQSMK